jgi:hypothetical protein
VHILYIPSVEEFGLVEYFCTHPDICCCFRGRSELRGWRRWVEVASAPNSACGVGPVQDAFVCALLWFRARPWSVLALEYYCSLFNSCYHLYQECSSIEVVRWLNYLSNKCVISLLGLILVSHLVSTYVGMLQARSPSPSPRWINGPASMNLDNFRLYSTQSSKDLNSHEYLLTVEAGSTWSLQAL